MGNPIFDDDEMKLFAGLGGVVFLGIVFLVPGYLLGAGVLIVVGWIVIGLAALTILGLLQIMS